MPDSSRPSAPENDRTDLIELTRTVAYGVARGRPAAIARGTRFGRYLVIDVIGSGGMGVVYLAEQVEPVRRLVAIKLMPQGLLSPERRLRFDIERQALARMNHPGIAQILDAGTTPEGVPWFVMEHVDGQPLDQWLASEKPGLRQRLGLLRDVARAVAHAHQRGLLHCDLKPSNVLVTRVDGRPFPKLIDFGIARTLGARGEGSSAGTPGYMSPEQGREDRALDIRSDVFSLGVLLFESIADRPYREWSSERPASLAEATLRIEAEQPRRPSEAAATPLPRARELDAIALRALAPDRERRYASADALADDIERWLGQHPVQALPASHGYRLRCFLRRHAAVSGAVGVFLLVCAFLLWRLLDQLQQTRLERDTAEQTMALLLDTFRAADPYEHPGGSLSVRELLRSGAHRIRSQPLQPEMRLRLLQALGDTQHRLELYADTVDTVSQALALLDAEQAASERGLSLALLRARALMNSEQFEQALEQVERTMALARRSGDAAAIGDGLILQAEILDYLEREDEASDRLVELERHLAQHPQQELRHLLLRHRGRMASDRYTDDFGIADLEQALTLADGLWGEDDLRSLDTLSDLAVARSRSGDMELSEALRRRVMLLTERIWGEDSAGLALAMDNLAVHLQRMGGDERLAEAEALTRRALAILRERLGPDSMHTAIAANNLASQLAAGGRHEEAVDAFALALQGLGEDGFRTGIVQHNLGRSLLALGQLERAEQHLQRSEAILHARLGSEDPRYSIWRLTQADLHLQRGEREQAVVLLDAAEPVLLRLFDESSIEVGRLRDLQRRL